MSVTLYSSAVAARIAPLSGTERPKRQRGSNIEYRRRSYNNSYVNSLQQAIMGPVLVVSSVMSEQSNPELPELPYDYDALEPHISEQVLTWHHDTHHQGYVNGLQAAEETLAENRSSGDFGGSAGALGNVTHNGSGHYLHTLFWENMSPTAAANPKATSPTVSPRTSAPTRAGRASSRAAAGAAGGWALLVYDPVAKRSSATSQSTSTTRARSGAPTPSWPSTSGNTPTTTTTVPTAAASSTPSSTSSTGRKPPKSTRSASPTSNRAVTTALFHDIPPWARGSNAGQRQNRGDRQGRPVQFAIDGFGGW